MGEKSVLSCEFDKERMRKEQVFQLVLSFSISVVVFALGITLMITVHPVFSLIWFYGLIYFVWWPFVFGFYLRTVKRPVEKIEIDMNERTVKINHDKYDLYNDRVYITMESGVAKFLHYAVLTLNVTDEEGKRIATYFMGPVAGKYSREARKDVNAVLPFISFLFQAKGSYDTVVKEKEETVGTVKIEFPAESIKKTFYATGSLILGIADFAFLFSLLPEPVYGDDKIIPGSLMLIRFLSICMIILGLILCVNFFDQYRRLARTVEVSWNMIKINGKEFLYSDIRRMGIKGAVEDPDNQGEDQAWLYINYRGQIHRFYLGQVKNKKCFEPRRRLKAALADYYYKYTNAGVI